MRHPDFKIPIEDKAAAEFWLSEWEYRFMETNDHAFKESADAIRHYIKLEFDFEDDDE